MDDLLSALELATNVASIHYDKETDYWEVIYYFNSGPDFVKSENLISFLLTA